MAPQAPPLAHRGALLVREHLIPKVSAALVARVHALPGRQVSAEEASGSSQRRESAQGHARAFRHACSKTMRASACGSRTHEAAPACAAASSPTNRGQNDCRENGVGRQLWPWMRRPGSAGVSIRSRSPNSGGGTGVTDPACPFAAAATAAAADASAAASRAGRRARISSSSRERPARPPSPPPRLRRTGTLTRLRPAATDLSAADRVAATADGTRESIPAAPSELEPKP